MYDASKVSREECVKTFNTELCAGDLKERRTKEEKKSDEMCAEDCWIRGKKVSSSIVKRGKSPISMLLANSPCCRFFADLTQKDKDIISIHNSTKYFPCMRTLFEPYH